MLKVSGDGATQPVASPGQIPAISGPVAISEHANAAGSNPLDATGSLRLTRAGTVSLHLPGEFVQTFSLDGPPSQDSGTHDCKLLTRPAPVGLVLHVTIPPFV